MKRHIFTSIVVGLVFSLSAIAQVPLNIGVQILKAEDSRNYNGTLEAMLRSPNAAVRERAAMAAGRIGDKRAVPALAAMVLEPSNKGKVVLAAIFALGEIEAAEGGGRILDILKAESGAMNRNANVLSRAIEAAGKIVAANPKDESLKELKSAIVRVLNDEQEAAFQLGEVQMAGATAVLRTRPDGGDIAVAKMLDSPDAGVRVYALNALTRLRSKQRLGDIRGLLRRDPDAVVRANAARVLGAAEDKEALPLLLDYALNGDDERVRVSCIRSLAALKDASVADKLIERGNQLMIRIHGDPAPLKPGEKRELKPIEVPLPKNELLEIVTAVGRLRANTQDAAAIAFLTKFAVADDYINPETMIAYARVAPNGYIAMETPTNAYTDFRVASAYAQGFGEIASLKNDDMNAKAGIKLTAFISSMATRVAVKDQDKMMLAMPDLMQAQAALKPDNLGEIARLALLNKDVQMRATAAGIMADLPTSKENVEALKSAFWLALINDKHENDAQLALMEAVYKLERKASVGMLMAVLDERDYLLRRRAFELLADKDLQKDFPNLAGSLAAARAEGKDQVRPYFPKFGTKLGQVLNTGVDYRRALSRKNGSIKAVLTTEKGEFTIYFSPEEAPLTVDNWVKLARAGYFNGLAVHRVVPNFVMQDGDPRGDGNGGPGWSIRCEMNMQPFDRGVVGMALSGKDTGGSQWFVTHSPQPHLDGGYTVFGYVNDKDMLVVDKIARGDKILRVVIIGK